MTIHDYIQVILIIANAAGMAGQMCARCPACRRFLY